MGGAEPVPPNRRKQSNGMGKPARGWISPLAGAEELHKPPITIRGALRDAIAQAR